MVLRTTLLPKGGGCHKFYFLLRDPLSSPDNGCGATPPHEEGIIDAKQLAEVVLHTALDKKALDPVWLDVADTVGYADYFVIVSARNPRQVRAIADQVRQSMKDEHGLLPVGTEGAESANWVLVDYGDVVFHVFQESSRAFYDLDGLWGESPAMPLPEGAVPAESMGAAFASLS